MTECYNSQAIEHYVAKTAWPWPV